MDILDIQMPIKKRGYSNLTGQDYVSLGNSLISGAGSFLSSQNQVKAAQAQADAAKAQAEAAVKVAEYNAQIAAMNASAAGSMAGVKKPGMSTGVVVALVVFGVAILGTAGYLLLRKK